MLIKKNNFKSDGSSYLEVEATFRYSVLDEFEDRVFIVLTKIMEIMVIPLFLVCHY